MKRTATLDNGDQVQITSDQDPTNYFVSYEFDPNPQFPNRPKVVSARDFNPDTDGELAVGTLLSAVPPPDHGQPSCR